MYLCYERTEGPGEAITDSSYTQKPLEEDVCALKGARASHLDVWKKLLAGKQGRAEPLSVKKVASHRSAAEAVAECIPMHHWFGNLLADVVAGWAAKSVL